MKTFRLIWAPEGRTIATIQALTSRAAIRKAPMPWRQYLGEIRAEEIEPAAYTRCIVCGAKLPKSNTQSGCDIATRSTSISLIDPKVRFCTLRCAARYGCLCAKGHEARGNDISFKGVKS